MKTKIPIATAIIPIHNYGKWVGDAIKSVIAQDYPNMQIAVFNDGSNDNTHEECCFWLNIREEQLDKPLVEQKYLPTDDINNKIYYVANYLDKEQIPTFYMWSEKPTGGPSRPRNHLIDNMWNCTDIFCPLDADDYWHSNRISKVVEKFMEDAMIGAVWTDYHTLDVASGVMQTVFTEAFSLSRLMARNIVHSGCCYNKRALELVAESPYTPDSRGIWYDEVMRTAEDYDLWIRIAERMIMVQIPEPLLVARVHGDNSTNSVNKETWNKNWQRLQQKIAERNNGR